MAAACSSSSVQQQQQPPKPTATLTDDVFHFCKLFPPLPIALLHLQQAAAQLRGSPSTVSAGNLAPCAGRFQREKGRPAVQPDVRPGLPPLLLLPLMLQPLLSLLPLLLLAATFSPRTSESSGRVTCSSSSSICTPV